MIKSFESDNNCVFVRDTSPGHCPMGLCRSLDLRLMGKMAGGKGELDDRIVYCDELQTNYVRKYLIETSIKK